MLIIVIAPKHTKEIALDIIAPVPDPIEMANINLARDVPAAIPAVAI
jgi:hypothetical protein